MPSTNEVQERGISSEGVIAYRVQTRNPTVQEREGNRKPLYLMTLAALQPGQSAALDNGVKLTVTGPASGWLHRPHQSPRERASDCARRYWSGFQSCPTGDPPRRAGAKVHWFSDEHGSPKPVTRGRRCRAKGQHGQADDGQEPAPCDALAAVAVCAVKS